MDDSQRTKAPGPARTNAAAEVDSAESADSATCTDTELQSQPESAARTAAQAMVRDSAVRLRKGDSVGRLTVLEHLGEGGFGIVLAAYDPDLDRKVALKVLRPVLFDSARAEQARVRLLREARAMARINHPNVVTVHDVGTVAEQVYIAMEFVDGGTIDDWIERERPDWRQIVDAFVEAGRGLAVAHEANLVHRDVKPQNILVGTDGRVRVTDFGIVSAAGHRVEGGSDLRIADGPVLPGNTPLDATLTRTGAIVGTPAFMAPEQHAGDRADARADQFAFAVSLYRALYRQPPFAGDDYAALAKTVAAGQVRPPPDDSEVPAWIHGILLRALARDPDDRYPSMDQLVAALGMDPARSRRRRFAIAITAAAIAGLVGLTGFLMFARPAGGADPCGAIEQQLSGVWDPVVAAKVRAAFLATGRPHAAESYARVERAFDRHADEWIVSQKDACAAAQRPESQAAQLSYLRMACLAQRLDGLDVLAQHFAQADDGNVVDQAVRMALELEPIHDCADTRSISILVPPPEDSELATRVRAARRRLRVADALVSGGDSRTEEAVKVAENVLRDARELDYAPLVAEALTSVAEMHSALTGGEEVEEMFRAAIRAAEAGGHERLAARAWISLIRHVGWVEGKHEEALGLDDDARNAVNRAGGDPQTRAFLLAELTVLYGLTGRYEQALGAYEEAKTLEQQRLGHAHPAILYLENAYGVALWWTGRHEEAHRHFQNAIAVAKELYGPNHPEATILIANAAWALDDQGLLERAIPVYERAVSNALISGGPNHPSLPFVRYQAGQALRRAGRLAQAHTYLIEARDQQQKLAGDRGLVMVLILEELGMWALASGDPGTAIEHCRHARSIWGEPATASAPPPGTAFCIAEALVASGRLDEAIATLEPIVASWDPGPQYGASDLWRGRIRFALAKALWKTGGNRKRSLALAAQADVEYRDAATRRYRYMADEAVEVEGWLKARRR